MELPYWVKLNQRRCRIFFTDTILNIMYLFHQLCTQQFIFCLSNKPQKRDLKYFLVTDIICINTYFKVRTTYDEFEIPIKITSHAEITHSKLLKMLNILNIETISSIIHKSPYEINETCNYNCDYVNKKLPFLIVIFSSQYTQH